MVDWKLFVEDGWRKEGKGRERKGKGGVKGIKSWVFIEV